MLWRVFALKCSVFQKAGFSRFSIDRTCCSTNWKSDKNFGYNLPSLIGAQLVLDWSKLIFCCSILAWYLSCRQPVSRHLPRQLPRHLSLPQLSSITEGPIKTSFAIRLSFLRSLSICPRLFISQTLSLSLPTSSLSFLQAFSCFSTLGKLLIPLYSCISCFKT